MGNVIACVDAHVHLHACYEPDELLQNAYDNLSAAARSGVSRSARKAYFLLLAECQPDDCFGALRHRRRRSRTRDHHSPAIASDKAAPKLAATVITEEPARMITV